eukprot:753441-Hanusia_phi.AAC.2
MAELQLVTVKDVVVYHPDPVETEKVCKQLSEQSGIADASHLRRQLEALSAQRLSFELRTSIPQLL